MPSQKFEYVISGVKLTEEQKTAISAAIAGAVSKTLIGSDVSLLKGKVWGGQNGFLPRPIYGGLLAVAADHENLMQQITSQIKVR